MQLGFLRIERPPDIKSYFPSFFVRQKDFAFCGKRRRALPYAPASFLKKT